MQCNLLLLAQSVGESMAGILQQQEQSVNAQRFGEKYGRASLRRKINILEKKKSASRCFPLKGPQMRHRFPLSNSAHQHSSLRKNYIRKLTSISISTRSITSYKSNFAFP